MEGKDFRQIEIVVEALKRHRNYQALLEGTTPFIIYRVDTGMILARTSTPLKMPKQRQTKSARSTVCDGTK